MKLSVKITLFNFYCRVPIGRNLQEEKSHHFSARNSDDPSDFSPSARPNFVPSLFLEQDAFFDSLNVYVFQMDLSVSQFIP